MRGDGELPHSLSAVFRLLWDPIAKTSYDTQLDFGNRAVVYNPHTVNNKKDNNTTPHM